MWCVLSLEGLVEEVFPGVGGWRAAVRFAERAGGDLEIVWSLAAERGKELL